MCFYDKFNSLCYSRGKSANAVAKEIGLSSGIVTIWKQQNTVPRLATIKKVANYFNVSIESLMQEIDDPSEEKQKPATSGDGHINMTEQQKEALSLISQLTDQEVSIVLSQLKGILQDRSAPGDPKE